MKFKRLISIILVMIIMATSLTTNVFALEGCDGTLDTGEIELESYIEWNTFKSKIDGVSTEVLNELRTAEARGILPEIFPVGDDQMVVKTDVGFYSFLRTSDGTYKTTSTPVRFAHWGDGKNTQVYYTGTGTPAAGEIQSLSYTSPAWCCAINSIIDYGYAYGNFYILANVYSNFDEYGNDVKHSQHNLNSSMSTDDSSTSNILFVTKPNSGLGIQEALHGYNNNNSSGGNSRSVSVYIGDESIYLVHRRWRIPFTDDVIIQEYNLKNANIYTYPRDALALQFSAANGTVSTISGKLKELNDMEGMHLNAPVSYPSGSFTHYGYSRRDDTDYDNYFNVHTVSGTYSKDDDGTRKIKPVGGIVDPLLFTGLMPIDNVINSTTPGPNSISTTQAVELKNKMMARNSENGVPFYVTITHNKNSSNGSWFSSGLAGVRTTRKYNEVTYHDGVSKFYRRYTPKLANDGKYILEQNTVHMIGTGVSKNATRLTFDNLSLGSDAKIDIYGCPITATGSYTTYGTNTSLVLLETITSSKNSLGKYTTPIYPYGEIKIEFTGGSSTSGRGEGYVITDIESGRYGTADFETVIERVSPVHCPHIYYGGADVINATIPSGGKLSSVQTAIINSSTVPSRAYHKIMSNVYVNNGEVIRITNRSYSGTSYDAFAGSVQLQLHPVGSSTVTATLSTTSSSRGSVTSTAASGYYDIYAYNYYYNNTYYTYNVSIGSDVWDTVTSTSSGNLTFDSYDRDLDQFQQTTYKLQYSDLVETPTSNITKFNRTVTVGRGDTVRVSIHTANVNTANNTQLYFTPSGTTNNLGNPNAYGSLNTIYYNTVINGKYTKEMFYLTNNTSNVTYELSLYDYYWNNATYKFRDGDYIEITIYKPKFYMTKTLNKDDMSVPDSASYYLLSKDEKMSRNTSHYNSEHGTSQYMLFDLSIVPGGYSYSYHRMYLNNSWYYLNSAQTVYIINNNGNEPYFINSQGSATYNQYLQSGTSVTLTAYETAFQKILYTSWHDEAEINVTPTIKSGYNPALSTLQIKMPSSSYQTYYRIYADDVLVKSDFYSSSSYNLNVTLNIPFEDGETSKTIRIQSRPYGSSYQYYLRDMAASYTLTNYYYDTAGTRINRYTVNGTKTWNYEIKADEGHFSRLKITDINIPEAFTVTVNGTEITGNRDFGWLNTNKYDVVVTVTGDGVHGNIPVKEIGDMFKYTLDTKSLYDATSYTSNVSGLSGGKISASFTPTYNSNGALNGYNVTKNNETYTINNTSNSYVRIISNVNSNTHPYSSNNEPGVTITATGLGESGSSSVSVSGYWDREYRGGRSMTFGTWQWLPASSSSIVVSAGTSVVCENWGKKGWALQAPSGYTVTGYQTIKHTNIPDSTIKTYSVGSSSAVNANNLVISKEMLDSLREAGADKLVIYAAVGFGASNGIASNNSSYVYCHFGKGSLQDSNGNVIQDLVKGENTYELTDDIDRIVYEPTSTYTKGASNYNAVTNVSWGTTGSLSYYNYSSSTYYFNAVAAMKLGGIVKSGNANNNIEMASVPNYSDYLENNVGEFKDSFTFNVNTMAGANQFEDGRFGTPKITIQYYINGTNHNRLQRVDVYRKHADGTLANLAIIPVTATNSSFKEYYDADTTKVDSIPCRIYHIGNDLMYVGANDVISNSNGTEGRSLAWLRTGHWHLKGSADEIEGITQGGINNPVKTMETDDADTEIVVNELDMNAKSWQMGHNIKDGKVTDQKLSDDVKKELREINLGTVTFIKGDGEQYKYVPVGTYGVDADTLDGTRLKYGTRYVDIYAYDDNQVEIEVLTSMIGNKNINGTTSGSLSTGEHIFTGNVTVDGVSVPVVLQVNVINRPTTSGKTTITLTD